jgi:hypothetical protein
MMFVIAAGQFWGAGRHEGAARLAGAPLHADEIAPAWTRFALVIFSR